MVLEPVLCPDCGSDDVVKHGRSNEDKQRYKCRNSECRRCTFIRTYADRGYLPQVKEQITEMTLNGSGIRDSARVLSSTLSKCWSLYLPMVLAIRVFSRLFVMSG